MPTELAPAAWHRPPLAPGECGPYGAGPRPDDAAKAAVWDAYRAGRPTRVPVTLGTNNRVLLLDGRCDAAGLTYERVFHEPHAMLLAQLGWQLLVRQRYARFCDLPTALPDTWEVGADFQNVYEAAFFGAPVHFHARGIPETRVILAGDRREAVFDIDIDRPLARGHFRDGLELTERMQALAAGCTFFGRPIRVTPYAPLCSDGPLTVALNLRGPEIFSDLRRAPDYAARLFAFIVAAALRRRAALLAHYALSEPGEVWLADDAIALLGVEQYRAHILPHHRTWYEALDADRTRRRCIHLCGDATRHFPTLHAELGVTCFDTGFPVDFGALRRTLGPDVELLGGVEAPLLVDGSPDAVYRRGREILDSGVRVGGRFIFREGNNLPPHVPWPNLAAFYRAALDAGPA